jgi:hypothetical protein
MTTTAEKWGMKSKRKVVLNDYLDEAKPLHLDMFVAHVLPH